MIGNIHDLIDPPVCVLVITFFHNLAFNAGTFYLALYFQVRLSAVLIRPNLTFVSHQAVNSSTPLEAGIQILPYSLGSSLASMPAAWLIGYWQKKTGDTTGQKWVITSGLLISTVGFGKLNQSYLDLPSLISASGLLMLLNEHSSRVAQSIYVLIAGIGIGMLFHAPYQVFAKALGPSDLAVGTSAFFLVRFTGATIGLVRFPTRDFLS